MRMDRYEEEFKYNDSKQTRTNKNQELYTDVYLNNVYVDINNLKDVMHEDIEEEKDDKIKIRKEPIITNYSYEDKNYDIVSLIEESLKNKKDDKVKRNLDFSESEVEIANLIESINENQKVKDKESFNDDNNLLSDLMPSNENTMIVAPLEEPILDTYLIENYQEEKEVEEVSSDMLGEEISESDLEADDSFIEKDSSKVKMIILVLSILIVIGIILGILFYLDII